MFNTLRRYLGEGKGKKRKRLLVLSMFEARNWGEGRRMGRDRALYSFYFFSLLFPIPLNLCGLSFLPLHLVVHLLHSSPFGYRSTTFLSMSLLFLHNRVGLSLISPHEVLQIRSLILFICLDLLPIYPLRPFWVFLHRSPSSLRYIFHRFVFHHFSCTNSILPLFSFDLHLPSWLWVSLTGPILKKNWGL